MVEIEVVSESLSAPSRAKGKTKRVKKTTRTGNPSSILGRAATADYEKAQQTAPFVTPTLPQTARRSDRPKPATKSAVKLSRKRRRSWSVILRTDFCRTGSSPGDATNSTGNSRSFIDGRSADGIRVIAPRDRNRARKRFSSFLSLEGLRRTHRRPDPRPRSAAADAVERPDHGRRHRSHLREKRLALPGRL